MTGYIIDFINVFVEIWAGYSILKTFGERRFRAKLAYMVEWSGYIGLCCLIAYNRLGSRYSTAMNVVFFICLCVICKIFYCINTVEIMAWNGCWLMIIGWLELIGLMIASMVEKKDLLTLNYAQPVSNHIYLLVLTVFIIIWNVYYSRSLKSVIYKMIQKYSVGIIVLALSAFFIFFPYFMGLGYEIISKKYLLFTSLAMIIMVLICIVLCILSIQAEEKEKMLSLALSLKNGEIQLKGLEQKAEALDRKEHDFKHHLQYISQCLSNNEIKEAQTYIENLEIYICKPSKGIYSGNHTMDIILDNKIQLAKESNIEVNVNVDFLLCPLKDADLCVVLGNLLDNAIEAAQVCDVNKRWVNIHIYSVKKMFFIEIDNSCLVTAKKIKGGFKTTKKDKNKHGIGLKSVKAIVEEYGGNVSFEYDENHFKIMIDFYNV